jgi:hypothetical protein
VSRIIRRPGASQYVILACWARRWNRSAKPPAWRADEHDQSLLAVYAEPGVPEPDEIRAG